MRRPQQSATAGSTPAISDASTATGRLTITGRKKEIIVLSNGKNIYPEEIEAHYRQSPFIKELCVLGLTRPGEPSAERLYAVVVPDADALREKKVVNAGDLIRFEMEGRSVGLAPPKRVLGYEVWMEPLPRTSTGKLKRFEIERRVQQDRRNARAGPRRRCERRRSGVGRTSRRLRRSSP